MFPKTDLVPCTRNTSQQSNKFKKMKIMKRIDIRHLGDRSRRPNVQVIGVPEGEKGIMKSS